MPDIRLNDASGLPVFQQIVEQIIFMIGSGELEEGDRLPATRLLAANLGVNRNTTARAYAELQELGYVDSRGRGGTVVCHTDRVKDALRRHEEAIALLDGPVRDCMALGLSPSEIASIAYQRGVQSIRSRVAITFVECTEERAKAFASELADVVEETITPVVLDALEDSDAADADLVITTFFHYADVRRRVTDMQHGPVPEFLAIVVAPHVKTLVRLARIPQGKRIGILYTTEDQAEAIRQSLDDTGLTDVTVLHSADDAALEDCDVVIVPSENPDLAERLSGRTETIEFGNILDAASKRMVAETVGDLRERQRSNGLVPAPEGAG